MLLLDPQLMYFMNLNVFRRHICEFLDQLLHTWPTHALEKHVALLQVILPVGRWVAKLEGDW